MSVQTVPGIRLGDGLGDFIAFTSDARAGRNDDDTDGSGRPGGKSGDGKSGGSQGGGGKGGSGGGRSGGGSSGSSGGRGGAASGGRH